MLRVTTSWDDGDILDKRLSDLLLQYKIKGTFYITKNYRHEYLSNQDIQEISKFHEIGAHSLTHPDLRKISAEERKKEIEGSKQWLENLLGHQIDMFCYPSGYYSTIVSSSAKEAGFRGARTTDMGSLKLPDDPFCIETTLQVYPFPFRKLSSTKFYWRRLLEPYIQRAPKLRELGVNNLDMYSWFSIAKSSFDIALEKGGVFHLWGHSWEIQKYDMWDISERFLRYIAGRKDCVYLTNGELLDFPKH